MVMAPPQMSSPARYSTPNTTGEEMPRHVALIGAGPWGRNLARSFHTLGALAAVSDPDASALAKCLEGLDGVEAATSVAQVLGRSDVTAVAIAAPAALHYALAKQALDAGKDVFVEKPLCLDVKEGVALGALADREGRVLMVGHLLRYHPHVCRLLELVAQGELGRLHYITSNRLNLGRIRNEENALWSFAPHDLSVILALAGYRMPESIRCDGESYLTQGVCDTTLTSLRFSEGLRAHVYVSWLNPFKEQKLTVVGSKGMAVFDDTQPWATKLVVFRDYLRWQDGRLPVPTRATGTPVLVPEAEPLLEECRHFLECCAARRSPRTDAAEGLRVLQLLSAAQASLERNGEAVSPTAPPAATYFVHPTAVVDAGADVGPGTKVWHFSHVSAGARLGAKCNLGQNVFIADGVTLGQNVKVQNNVSIYTGAIIEDDVFLGPSCVLTNVSNPRSQVLRHALYEPTVIRKGASVGANATIVCGVTIGRYAFIAAGAVVTKDVPDYALIVGNPGRVAGWMSRHGHRLLVDSEGAAVCPESGYRYQREGTGPGATLRCLDLAEDTPLPSNLAKGERDYRSFKV